MGSLTLLDLRKRYGALESLKGIDISLDEGEFLVLLGPSGCGKSTILNIIAELIDPTGGDVQINGKSVVKIHPKNRNVAMVFQSLRAHMQGAGFSYPHHSGHGIGTSVHEWPRLVPDEPALIEENMVLMVEPGSYRDGIGGVRCEHMLRVTATGVEVLTDFQMEPLV